MARASVVSAQDAVTRLERITRQVPGLLYEFELLPGQAGRFLYISERGTDLFGVPVAHALVDADAVFAAIEHEDRRRMNSAMHESAATLGEWRSEFRVRRSDGEWRWMLGTATPERLAPAALGVQGGTRWYGYVEDVTERRQLDQARQEAAVADAANRAKTEFLSRMSHELRTPLNAVLGFAQLMEIDRAEPAADGQRRRLKLIREAGEHLLHMIGDMLDLTRIEAGGMALNLEPVAVRELAEQTLELVRDLADKAQVQLLLECHESGQSITVQADRTRLRQVLLNLLSNGIKYNRPGGRVVLRVAMGEGIDSGHAAITVSDTGVGIAEADLPRIFEPFQRGSQVPGGIDGAGIGLAVTRALVQLMGGRIEATSRPGQGSVFCVRLGALPSAHAAGYSAT